MTLLPWCKQQPWWEVASFLLSKGMIVIMHVPKAQMPPGAERDLHQKSTNGRLRVVSCPSPHWHIGEALPHEAWIELVSKADASAVPELKNVPKHFHRDVGEA